MAKDPYRYFRIEANELLEQLGKGVLDLEKGGGAPDLVPRLLRLTHTLKGAARVVKQREIADQAHAIEGILAPFRETQEMVPRDRIEAVLQSLDGIGAGVAALTLPTQTGANADKPALGDALQTVRTDIAEMDALLDGLAQTHTRLRSLRQGLGPVERARTLANLLAEQRAPRHQRDAGHALPGDSAPAVAEELRGIVDTLERGLATSLDQMDRELRQVRAAAEQLRLVPASVLFTGLQRAARDAAQALGKQVGFEGRGGGVRLDAHVLDAIQGALLQLVSNAVAHGIESEAGRRAAGKPVEGRVSLEVQRRGARIAFVCVDDGGGIDLQAVRSAAQRKGLRAPDIQEPDALLRLLLRGGISTSGAVTEVSGRGIGLDLARAAAKRLGGDIDVHTAAGKGTRIELVVPLSMTSFEALMVQARGTTAALALDAVRRTLRLPCAQVVRAAQGESILYADQMIPFLSLSRALGESASAPSREGRPWSILVIESATGIAAIGVDRVVAVTRVVFRPLPQLVPASALVAGASLDAEGNPQLVLDADALVALAHRASVPVIAAATPQSRVLVVDDSLTTRMLEQSILESAGFDVGVAASAEEALEQARRSPYALFLVDVEMPGMDGFSFIEQVRADPLLKRIPAILVTSRSSAEDRRRGTAAGAQGYIVKSEFDQVAFLGQVRQLVAPP
ncbi:MAG TPA: response regulator [Burkholderiaceae bacterium]|nr:response regulator [Burkholderiaceae bacterium]